MDTRGNRLCSIVPILCIVIITLLVSCQPAATPTVLESANPDPALFTVEALQTENARLSTQVAELDAVLAETTLPTPTATQAFTSTPMSTPTPSPGPTLSVPEGLVTVTHNAALQYLFVIDPELWELADASDPASDFLVHKDLDNCKVNLAPETITGDLTRYYPRIIGPHGWLVEAYEDNLVYTHQDLKLAPSISEDAECIQAQDELLAGIIPLEEYIGYPTSTPAIQPTQRVELEGFNCANALPTRLRVRDRVLVSAGFLWLRDAPRVEENTEIRIFQQYEPVEIEVTGGPLCVENSVFWEVTVVEQGEGGETLTGWMAENNADQYFLELWYLGW